MLPLTPDQYERVKQFKEEFERFRKSGAYHISKPDREIIFDIVQANTGQRVDRNCGICTNKAMHNICNEFFKFQESNKIYTIGYVYIEKL